MDASADADADAGGRTEQTHPSGGFPGMPRPRRRTVLTAGAVVVVLGAELVVVVPHAGRAAGELSHARFAWLLPALACEMVSMMMFARLQRHALGVDGLRVGLGSSVAMVFAGNAVGATLPGGSLAAITYRAYRMRSWGASVSQIGFAHAATGVLGTIALVLLAGVAHLLAGDSSRILPAALRIAALCALTSGALALFRRPAVLRRPVHALFRLVHRLRRGAVGRTSADGALTQLAAMRTSPRFWGYGLGFALSNWGADFACLLAVCHAVGARPTSSTALFAYVAAMTAASAMPLLPAGIGTVDAALVPTLHHGGVPTGAATAADLLYRTITPGLVAVAGWILLIRQRRRPARPEQPYDPGSGPRADPAGSPAPGTIGTA
ncbi:lysylphosphatidylglycerol synthase transmembrane domain-containing protein [Streptomyces sp. MI02-7b]|uniref:lysylphosphatidylglycerol synthase transmembrane domain-containing protein n=1 Tax=Streptomyces sp. MI02-7b TaxID=462941 RepID=UPI0029A4781C|nr:lysylphosphatidylglycerol synthase transmembrane domain-containing protein [Streptomyces sp. MI02-7b]MDX3071123.1 lysylphosphatidylglycerol synthase transmembrane domain-containing protein [Streptomyces sp. MI02-7b]